MTTKIQLRRDTAANWTTANPTLFSGEVGFETDSGKFKIGNGSTAWASLDYFLDSSDLSGYLTASSASTTYLTQASASTTYLTQPSASSTYLTQVSASTTYLTQSSASTTYATKTELNNIDLSSASAAAVAAIVDSAPSTLNTLNELAAALGDDENFATTITDLIAAKMTSVPGMISPYAGHTAPGGWFLCDGNSVSRFIYPDLFSAITQDKGTFTVTIANPAVFTLTSHGMLTGSKVFLTTTGALPTGLTADTNYFIISTGVNTFNLATTFANATNGVAIATSGTQSGTHTLVHAPYGVGSAYTFYLPYLKGYTIVGLDTSQTEFNVLGETGGAKSVTLTAEESGLPAHNHGIADPGHIHYQSGIAINADGSRAGLVNPDGIGFTATGSQVTGISINNNTSASASQAHNNLQPYVVMNYIIRFAV